MVVGVAKQIARALTGLAGLVVAAVTLSMPARGQQPSPVQSQQAAPQAELFKLSGSCSAPDAAVSSFAPLPQLAEILQNRMQVRVLAVGNWVSAGMGNQHRFTDELEEILERSIKGLDLVFTHRGVSGERTATTAQRLMQEIALVDPDLVLWQVGTNDALMRVPVAEFEAVLSGAVDWIKSHKKDVVLVGLQYSAALSKNAHYRDIKDAVSRVAARHNVLVVRRYEAVQFIATASREQARLAKDEFLMTELGYKCMAEHIARALVVNVFARRNPDGKAGQVAVAPRVAQPAPAVSLPNDSRNDK
jgi:acyl-CoA thioesterase I